jgi:transcriptional regulator with XRE-family HTH domain
MHIVEFDGERLRLRRESEGMSQEQLGKLVADIMDRGQPFSKVTVSQWERSESCPSANAMFALCDVLMCNPYDLASTWVIEEEEEQPRKAAKGK